MSARAPDPQPIDRHKERIISLKDGGLSIPNGRGGVKEDTMKRWAKPSGYHGVRLATLVVGGARVTSVEAIDRFLAALNAEPAAC